VERLQEALRDLGLFSGAIDGVYSPEVRAAVVEFQHQNSIKTDGLAGPNTLRALDLY